MPLAQIDRLFWPLCGAAEGFLEFGLQLAALRHRPEDVGVAVERAVDEDLRQRRPVRHLRERLALRDVLEHVHDLERVAEAVEELDRLERKAAARRRLRALTVDEDLVRGDFLGDLVFQFVRHPGSFEFSATIVLSSTACTRPSLSAAFSAPYTSWCCSIRVLPLKACERTVRLK